VQRIVFFGDSNSAISSLLLERVIELSLQKDDLELVAVCDAARRFPRAEISRTIKQISSFYLRRWFGSFPERSNEMLLLPRLRSLCRRYGIPLLNPPDQDINHPEFIRQLQELFRPHLGLSSYCPQVFGSDLLSIFRSSVNYHNSLLPKYRGLRATAWSLYYRDSESGFTFHYMTEKIDDGRILLQRALPITPGISYRELEINKALLARSCLDKVLGMVILGKRGQAPTGSGTYFSQRDWKELTTIEEPGQIPASELLHRMACFEILNLKIGSVYYPVTGLVDTDTTGGLSFLTQDGLRLKPKRFHYLPYSLFKVCRLFQTGAGRA
jgi:hypothetical protein